MPKAPIKPVSKSPRRAGENGFTYRQRYALVVPCRDEAHQQELHAQLGRLGLKTKVVCV